MTTPPAQKLREFWNARYAQEAYAYGTEPNEYLVSQLHRFRPGGRVLCLADGEGRNSVYLAGLGFQVTAIDISDEGIRKGQRLAQERSAVVEFQVADVLSFDLKPSEWDAVVSIFLHLPSKRRVEFHKRCLAALKPGGVFVYEAYTLEQIGRGTGGPKEPQVLAPPEEAWSDFPEEMLVHRFAGDRDIREGSHHCGLGAICQFTAVNQAHA